MHKLTSLFKEYKGLIPDEISKTESIISEVPEQVKKEIVNILGEGQLADMMIQLTKHGEAGGFTDNIINEFEIEREVKVLDVNHAEIIEKLQYLGAVSGFTGWVDDVYLDYKDGTLEKKEEKVSFRFRFKITSEGKLSVYYTIKKKLDDETAQDIRSCFEKELELGNPELVLDMLGVMGLNPTRRKVKERTSYVLGNTKYDFDKTESFKIKPWLEIETDSGDKAGGIIELLGLSKKEILNVGSRKFYKHYGEDYDTLDDNSKIIVPVGIKKLLKRVL